MYFTCSIVIRLEFRAVAFDELENSWDVNESLPLRSQFHTALKKGDTHCVSRTLLVLQPSFARAAEVAMQLTQHVSVGCAV